MNQIQGGIQVSKCDMEKCVLKLDICCGDCSNKGNCEYVCWNDNIARDGNCSKCKYYIGFYRSNLNKRICDVEEGAVNTETYREFIINSSNAFDEDPKVDEMTEEELHECIDRYDLLWEE
jgi:hypothetical protein